MFVTRESSTASSSAASSSTTSMLMSSSSTPVLDSQAPKPRFTRRHKPTSTSGILTARYNRTRARRPTPPHRSLRRVHVKKVRPLEVISNLLRDHEEARLSRSAISWQLRTMAKDRSLYLPILVGQAVLRQLAKNPQNQLKWAASYLDTCDQFEKRVARLAHRGITTELLSHWVWILTVKDRDRRIRRCCLSPYKQTDNLLMYLLKMDDRDLAKETLVLLVDYLSKRHKQTNGERFHVQAPRFTYLALNLVKRSLAIWPLLLATLARLTAGYIKSIPRTASIDGDTHGYQVQCQIFNAVIQALGQEPRRGRQRAREWCWEAQKILLECSSTSEPQLIISRESYRSIRIVLLALPKTPMEAKVALRSSSNWPPYREEWDGTDELRNPEDDLSRASKAGILMHEAGYESSWIDEAMTSLGGSFPGRQPTVQTRTLEFKFKDDPEALWTARMLATRTAREAWRVFQTPPIPGLLPTSNVYAVMFAKLHALPVDMPGIVPGDTRRVFPAEDGNLSAYSISVLDPPTPKALYNRMLKQRLAPTGECLKLLIRTASSMREALRYFEDSPYSQYAPVLRKSLGVLSKMDWSDLSGSSFQELREMLHLIPGGVVVAWIIALCRFHKPRVSAIPSRLKNALFLAKLYHSGSSGSQKAETMFREIAKAIARGKLLPSTLGRLHNAGASLRVFLAVFSDFKSLERKSDEQMFKFFSVALRKSIYSFVFKRFYRPRSVSVLLSRDRGTTSGLLSRYAALLLDCRRGIVHEFNLLVQPPNLDATVCAGAQLRAEFPLWEAHTLFYYMRALAVLGNTEEMVRLVEWVFDSYERGDIFPKQLITPGNPHFRVFVDSLAYFDKISEKMIHGDIRKRLKDRLDFLQKERGCPWFIPEPKAGLRQVIVWDVACAETCSELTSGWTMPSSPQIIIHRGTRAKTWNNGYVIQNSLLEEY
ncbi:hypothetical protein V8F20_011157 [Naviculisporaceae sp. PSN 640]